MNAKILAEEKTALKYTRRPRTAILLRSCCLYQRTKSEQNPNQSTLANRPGYLRAASSLALVLVIGSIGEEVALEEPGQGGGGAFGTCFSLLHCLDLGIIIAIGDDVACGQVLKIDNAVCRDYAEGLLDPKAEGALEPFGRPVTQGPQTVGQRAAQLATLTLGTLARGYGGFLQVIVVPLQGRVNGLGGLLRRGLLRHLLPQL